MNHHTVIHTIVALLVVFLSRVIPAAAAVSDGTASPTPFRVLDSISPLPTEVLLETGERMFVSGDYDGALGVLTVACGRYDAKAPRERQREFASAFSRYGNILYKKGAYSQAMDAYLKVRRIAEEHGLDAELAAVYVRIGNIYAACGDYSGARDFYRRALDIEVLKDEERYYLMAVNNMFTTSLLSDDIEGARSYLDLYRHHVGKGRGESREKYDILLGEGLLAEKRGDMSVALREYKGALSCAETAHLDPLCIGSAYSCLGGIYEETGSPDSAIFCLKRAKEIAVTSGNGRLVVESLRDIADFFENAGQPDSVAKYRRTYLSLADSISYQEEINKLKSSQMLYELDKSEYTIRSLNADKKAQKTVIWVIAVAASVCLVLVGVLLRQNRKLKTVWADLYKKNSRELNEKTEYRRNMLPMRVESDLAPNPDEVTAPPVSAEPSISDGDTDTESVRRRPSIDGETQNKIAAAVLEYMENGDGYCSSDFSLEKLSGEVGYNQRYVSEAINVVFSKNFRAMLNEYRIRKAMQLLQDTEHYGHYTIKAISELVGYKSQATFISVFTKITGLKPGIFQKLARDERQS